MNKRLDRAKELLATQGNNGNWNYDEYMTGMYNGMELVVSTMEDREPNYRDITKESPIKRLVKALKEDAGYYQGWVANIAMSFVDHSPECMEKDVEALHKAANDSAKSFLKNLMQ